MVRFITSGMVVAGRGNGKLLHLQFTNRVNLMFSVLRTVRLKKMILSAVRYLQEIHVKIQKD